LFVRLAEKVKSTLERKGVREILVEYLRPEASVT
jgi:hypothetical protein